MTSHAAARTRRVLAAIACALVATAARDAQACDLCAIYTGSLMRQANTGVYLGVSEQYARFDDVQVDGKSAPNVGDEWMNSSITQVVIGYQATRQLAVQLNLPLISREYRRLEDGMPTRGDIGGAGDLSVVARYAPLSRAVGPVLLYAELLAGLKLPSGNTDLLAGEHDHGEEAGDRHGHLHDDGHDDHDGGHDDDVMAAVHNHALTLGTGSVDGVFGSTMFADWKRVFTTASFQYLLRGNGDYGYEFADELRWEVAPGVYVLTHHDWTAALRAVLSGEHKGRDHQHGMLVEDTKLDSVYLGPGAWLTWSDAFAMDFAVDLPVDQESTGRQIVMNWRVRGGLSWRF